MAGYFWDTSAIVKLYHSESGSATAAAIFDDPIHRHFISSLSIVELQSAFGQKVRSGKISTDDGKLVQQIFANDVVTGRFQTIHLRRRDLRTAESLVMRHSIHRRIRTLDAIQLGAFLNRDAQFGIAFLLCADRHLVEVAQLEGVAVINPDTL